MSGISLSNAPFLELVNEEKIYKLLSGSSKDDTIDASGICAMDGNFYVIFDDSAHIARFGPSLTPDDPANALYRFPDDDIGREDITFDERHRRFLVITEAVREDDGTYKPKVTTYDAQLRFVEDDCLDFALEGKHKGMEGLARVHRQGQVYLLGLCQGNHCRGGRRGRRPGGGRIQVFQKGKSYWEHCDTIELPAGLPFVNYSSLAIRDNRVAVVSSDASAIWLGELQQDAWSVLGEGALYRFPLTKKSNVAYCTVDGISWLDESTLVAVSDHSRSTFGFKNRCRKKDRSIHIFRFPSA